MEVIFLYLDRIRGLVAAELEDAVSIIDATRHVVHREGDDSVVIWGHRRVFLIGCVKTLLNKLSIMRGGG